MHNVAQPENLESVFGSLPLLPYAHLFCTALGQSFPGKCERFSNLRVFVQRLGLLLMAQITLCRWTQFGFVIRIK